MNTGEYIDFDRIAKAIGYIAGNFKSQPDLDEIARAAGLSPHHFQRLFTKWAGTSPKKFLQYISLEHAKNLLKDNKTSVLRATVKTGLSSPGRLHDLFVTIEGMTPGEYKNGGEDLVINHSFAESPFGIILIASTSKGICYLAFVDEEAQAIRRLRTAFPRAIFKNKHDLFQRQALSVFGRGSRRLDRIKLHLKGTDFQLKVWQALLTIPPGGLSSYGRLAEQIGKPTAMRAVGTAVGDNPVAFLIPCHRVIRATGVFGNYRGGSNRKLAMIGWEAVRRERR